MELPTELWFLVAAHLPLASHLDSSGPLTLVNLSQVCSQLGSIALKSRLWEIHYKAKWVRSDPMKERLRHQRTLSDYRAMYVEREDLDRRARRCLTAIIHARQRNERLFPASVLAAELGYDVWDTLLASACITPERLFENTLTSNPQDDDLITRKHWAREVQQLIQRYIGVSKWTVARTELIPCKLEEAVAALSTFVGHDIFEVIAKFRELAAECRIFLDNEGINLDVYSQSFDLSLAAERVCYWMRQQGFGLPAPAQYHRISHHFPHLFLTTSRKTIPLSMVCVFVAIGQHIGLQVSPVNYPRKVLAHIQHPQPTGAGIWVDVTGSLGRIVLDYQLDVVASLAEGNEGNPFPDIRSWISPASVPSMLIRSANNILNSFRMRGWDDDVNDDDHLNAGGLYGAGCIIALFDGRPDVLSRILDANHLFPLDDKVIFVDLILNALPDGTLRKAEAVMAADLRINTRQTVFSRVSAKIQFTVGMCLRHQRFGYSGIITGWDPHCGQSEDWINQMQVDDLAKGREQPFYNVLSTAGIEYYVAEENIEPIRVTPNFVLSLLESDVPVGQLFRGVAYPSSRTEYGYFVPTAFLKEAYPEDEPL